MNFPIILKEYIRLPIQLFQLMERYFIANNGCYKQKNICEAIGITPNSLASFNRNQLLFVNQNYILTIYL